MKVQVKGEGLVEVRDRECLKRSCFWVTTRSGKHHWSETKQCGHREQCGCPERSIEEIS